MRRWPYIAILLLCWLLPAAGASAADDDVEGNADGDRIVLVGSVLVDRDETAGDIVVFDGDVTIRGAVDGDVVVFDGDVAIRGNVRGNVVTFAGRALLGRRGRVDGDLVYGDKAPLRAPGSVVDGKVEKVNFGDLSIIGAIGIWIAMTVSFLVLGLILLFLAPKAGEAIARTAKARAPIAGLVGLLAFFLIPIIAVVAFVTVIGLPLGFILLFAIVPLYAIAYLATALVAGRLILKKATVLAFVVGLVILQLLTLIPIAGGIVGFLAMAFGLGALLLTLLRARA
ncbi:MAG: hypothetical protein ACRDLN_14495 [Solirubrobacteraceae bacterium]